MGKIFYCIFSLKFTVKTLSNLLTFPKKWELYGDSSRNSHSFLQSECRGGVIVIECYSARETKVEIAEDLHLCI